MNSAWILLIVLTWMFFGYRIYGSFIERQIKPSKSKKTPATLKKDDIDFSPSKKPFLVGHHFASIAGAGPIIGPILAISYFGWLPVVIWISLGSVFIGAMHDYITLMGSVRNKAKGVSNIAKEHLGSTSGFLFGVMIWVTLTLIITVFSVSAAESIISKPELVIPLFAITLISVLLGLVVQKTKINYKLASLISILLVFFCAYLGFKFPLSLGLDNPALVKHILVTIILFYAGLASVVPVWLLLRPRDYLSAIQMGIIFLLGFLAILIVQPTVQAPAYIPGSPFPLWPILFITVACGAVSGFHGIVSSGTTSKQLANETHGRVVGYGAMLGEASLAILVTLVSIAGLTWGAGVYSFQEALGKGWIILFSSGYGNIVGSMGIPLITIGFASVLGAFMVNQFILTSIDTSTRLGRLLITESLIPSISNRYIATALTLIPAWLLAITNSYEVLWRLFGSSNQLIASISMIAVAAFFISTKKNVKYILIPAFFVLITTLAALLYLTFRSGGYFAEGNYILLVISFAMFALGAVVSFEGLRAIYNKR